MKRLDDFFRNFSLMKLVGSFLFKFCIDAVNGNEKYDVTVFRCDNNINISTCGAGEDIYSLKLKK